MCCVSAMNIARSALESVFNVTLTPYFKFSVGTWLGGSVWAKETNSIEMNQVRRCIRHPNLGFPGNVVEISAHDSPVWKGGDIDQSSRRCSEQAGKLGMPLAINRPVTRDRLHQDQPIFGSEVQDDIRHFTVGVHRDAQFGEQCCIKIAPFVAGVPGINQYAAGCKARSEVFDNRPDQFAVLAGTEHDVFSRYDLHRDTVLFPIHGVAGDQRLAVGQICRQVVVPRASAVDAQQG